MITLLPGLIAAVALVFDACYLDYSRHSVDRNN